jgi:hypothetical protein
MGSSRSPAGLIDLLAYRDGLVIALKGLVADEEVVDQETVVWKDETAGVIGTFAFHGMYRPGSADPVLVDEAHAHHVLMQVVFPFVELLPDDEGACEHLISAAYLSAFVLPGRPYLAMPERGAEKRGELLAATANLLMACQGVLLASGARSPGRLMAKLLAGLLKLLRPVITEAGLSGRADAPPRVKLRRTEEVVEILGALPEFQGQDVTAVAAQIGRHFGTETGKSDEAVQRRRHRRRQRAR